MADHTYVGRAKYYSFPNGGEVCNISITPEGREAIADAANASTSGWCNLKMVEMRQADRRGNTHTLYIDDYKPGGDGGQPAPRRHAPQGRPAPRPQRPADDGGFGAPQSAPPADDNYDNIPF